MLTPANTTPMNTSIKVITLMMNSGFFVSLRRRFSLASLGRTTMSVVARGLSVGASTEVLEFEGETE